MTQHLFRFRAALFRSDLPSTTRHVLLTLSTHGDEDGGDIFPATRTLAGETGLSRRTVEGRLREAEQAGWIHREPIGQGQGWKRIRYTLLVPQGGEGASPRQGVKVEQELPHVPREGGESDARRGESDDPNVGKDVPLTSSGTSSGTSSPPGQEPETPPSWTGSAGDAWREVLGGVPPVARIGRALRPLVAEHGSEEVLATWGRYLEETAARFVSPEAFSSKFGAIRDGALSRNGDRAAGREADPYEKLVEEYNAQVRAAVGTR